MRAAPPGARPINFGSSQVLAGVEYPSPSPLARSLSSAASTTHMAWHARSISISPHSYYGVTRERMAAQTNMTATIVGEYTALHCNRGKIRACPQHRLAGQAQRKFQSPQVAGVDGRIETDKNRNLTQPPHPKKQTSLIDSTLNDRSQRGLEGPASSVQDPGSGSDCRAVPRRERRGKGRRHPRQRHRLDPRPRRRVRRAQEGGPGGVREGSATSGRATPSPESPQGTGYVVGAGIVRDAGFR